VQELEQFIRGKRIEMDGPQRNGKLLLRKGSTPFQRFGYQPIQEPPADPSLAQPAGQAMDPLPSIPSKKREVGFEDLERDLPSCDRAPASDALSHTPIAPAGRGTEHTINPSAAGAVEPVCRQVPVMIPR